MKRREVVKGLALSPFAMAAIPGAGPSRASPQKPVTLVLQDVTFATPPDLLFALIDPLASLNVPLSLAIDPLRGEPAENLRVLLRGLLRDYSGFVEICVSCDLPEGADWYATARIAAEGQSKLREFVMDRSLPSSRRLQLTLVSKTKADAAGIRTAGFRLALLGSGAVGPVVADSFASGVSEIRGGRAVTSLSDFETLPDHLFTEQGSSDPAVIYLSMSMFAGMSRQQVFAAAARTAAGLSGQADAGTARFILPMDYLLQYQGGFSRRVGIALAADPSDTARQQKMVTLAEALVAGDIPVSFVSPLGQDLPTPGAAPTSKVRTEYCIGLGTAPGDDVALRRALATRLRDLMSEGVTPDCVSAGSDTDAVAGIAAQAGFGMLCPAKADAAWFVGLDDSGLQHLPVLCSLGATESQLSGAELSKEVLRQAGNVGDFVILVEPDFVNGAGRDTVLKQAMAALASAPENGLVSMRAFGIGDVPENRALNLIGSVRRGRLLGELEFRAPEQAERDLFMEDAHLAWSYFARYADPKTALVPGTVSGGADGEFMFSYVTIWDCGTQLLSLVASHGLGLIGDKDYFSLTSAILGALHSSDVTVSGIRLPKAFMSTTGSGEGDPGYDATDMGRLLNALNIVKGYSKGQIDPAPIVAAWDLDKTIANRQVHSIKDGVFKSIQNTTYANYALRGFRAWGFDVAPAFAIDMTGNGLDEQIRVLEALSRREPVGAEPHVLEGLELGHSPFSRLVSDVLYEKQLQRHRETGKFVCVSEGPLDHEPWFSYQGYRVLDEEDPWAFEIADNNPRFHTEGFRLANEVVNTKSAYAWAALRPQDYSRSLLSYVRSLVRIPGMGLSSGIYSELNRPMRLYSDLNTNGVALEAIAYVINGNRPLCQQAMGR